MHGFSYITLFILKTKLSIFPKGLYDCFYSHRRIKFVLTTFLKFTSQICIHKKFCFNDILTIIIINFFSSLFSHSFSFPLDAAYVYRCHHLRWCRSKHKLPEKVSILISSLFRKREYVWINMIWWCIFMMLCMHNMMRKWKMKKNYFMEMYCTEYMKRQQRRLFFIFSSNFLKY